MQLKRIHSWPCLLGAIALVLAARSLPPAAAEEEKAGAPPEKPAPPRAKEEPDQEKEQSRAALREGQVRIKGALLAAMNSGDTQSVADLQAAAVNLAVIGGKESMRVLLGILAKVPATEDAAYWALIAGVASFADQAGLKELGDYLQGHKDAPLARDIVYGLVRNRSPQVIDALRWLAVSGPDDMRPMAASSIGGIRHPRSVDALIELLAAEEKRKPAEPTNIMWIATDGLTAITGQNFGPSSVNWSGWWAKNRKKPLLGGKREAGASTGTAVDYLDRLRREQYFGVEKAPKQKVVVLSAHYTKKTKRDLNNDHMERVLESMNIPHTVVSREDFMAFDLKGTGVILINCAQFHEFCICPTCKPGGGKNNRLMQCTGCEKHDKFSARLGGDAIKKLREFVLRGGYLFCEDWTVKEVVEPAFPKYVVAGVKLVRQPLVSHGGVDKPDPFVILKDSPVDVVPARGMATHAYLKGIFVAEGEDDGGTPELPNLGKYLDEDGQGEEVAGGGSAAGEEGEESTTVVVNPPTPEGEPEKAKATPVELKHNWEIDDESYALKIVDRQNVLPLLTSGRIQKVTDGDGVVAVAFRPGKNGVLPGQRSGRAPSPSASPSASGATSVGKGADAPAPRAGARLPGVVVVVLSHFGKQNSTADEHSIQNILLNVLLDAHSAQGGASRKIVAKEPDEEKEDAKEGGNEPGEEKEAEEGKKPAAEKKGAPEKKPAPEKKGAGA